MPDLTDDDKKLLWDIANSVDLDLARKIYRYYHDEDRAERTPRHYLYFHMGLLHGTLEKFVAQHESLRQRFCEHL